MENISTRISYKVLCDIHLTVFTVNYSDNIKYDHDLSRIVLLVYEVDVKFIKYKDDF